MDVIIEVDWLRVHAAVERIEAVVARRGVRVAVARNGGILSLQFVDVVDEVFVRKLISAALDLKGLARGEVGEDSELDVVSHENESVALNFGNFDKRHLSTACQSAARFVTVFE